MTDRVNLAARKIHICDSLEIKKKASTFIFFTQHVVSSLFYFYLRINKCEQC